MTPIRKHFTHTRTIPARCSGDHSWIMFESYRKRTAALLNTKTIAGARTFLVQFYNCARIVLVFTCNKVHTRSIQVRFSSNNLRIVRESYEYAHNDAHSYDPSTILLLCENRTSTYTRTIPEFEFFFVRMSPSKAHTHEHIHTRGKILRSQINYFQISKLVNANKRPKKIPIFLGPNNAH